MTPYRILTDEDPPLAYLDGVALGGGHALVISAIWGLEDEPDRSTRLLVVGGPEIEYLDINENIISLARVQTPNGWTVWALSKLSTVRRVFPDLGPAVKVGRPHGGSLVTLHADNGRLFATGMFGQIIEFVLPDIWKTTDDGAYQPKPTNGLRMLRSLASAPDGSMIACGLYGDCLTRRHKSTWQQVPVETNVSFEKAIYVPDAKDFFVCGDNGALGRVTGHGEIGEWTWIDTGSTDRFWDATAFRAGLVISTMDGLFKVMPTTGDVVPMEMDVDLVAGTYKTDAYGDELWSFGPMDIATFNGSSWKRIAVPGTD